MNALERLAKAGKTNSVGTYTFVDADTLRDPELKDENGKSLTYRLQGYDAPEVAGWKNGKWVQGTAGAAARYRRYLFYQPSPVSLMRSSKCSCC